MLTDSGGYQIFSLPGERTISEEGARFELRRRRMHLLSPERSIEMQSAIGCDIMMVLDECIDSTADEAARARGDGAHAPLGACAASRRRAATRRRRCSRSCRAACIADAARESAAFLTRTARSTASRSAASRWATRAPSART